MIEAYGDVVCEVEGKERNCRFWAFFQLVIPFWDIVYNITGIITINCDKPNYNIASTSAVARFDLKITSLLTTHPIYICFRLYSTSNLYRVSRCDIEELTFCILIFVKIFFTAFLYSAS